MCRSHGESYRRCKGSAAAKARESLRKAIHYQAKKAGVSVQDWKELNPDLLEVIHSSYDSKLKKFEQKEAAKTSFSNVDGETLLTGIQVPESAAKDKPIAEYKFLSKGELRPETLSVSLDDYIETAEKNTKKLKFTKLEKHAILCYSTYMYEGLNKYLLNKPINSEVFNKNIAKWKDSPYGWQSNFTDEADLIDFSKKLDSALSHRAGESRLLYRGMNVYPSSHSMLLANGGKEIVETKDRRKVLETTYAHGAELKFDAYSSASSAIDTAADCSSARSLWQDSPKSPTGVLFEIQSSAGLPIAHLSSHQEEREVLLPRGMRFRVANSYWNSTEEKDCYKYPTEFETDSGKNPNTLIVQLIEIDEHGNDVVDHSVKYKAPPFIVRSEVEKESEKIK